MGGRRTCLEISIDILRVARDGAKKSHIVYRANLNFKVVKRYLKLLQHTGLLTLTDRFYRTTEKGAEYINHYDYLREYMVSDR